MSDFVLIYSCETTSFPQCTRDICLNILPTKISLFKQSHVDAESTTSPLEERGDLQPFLRKAMKTCFSFLVEPASTKENNCLNAAKACNLNDTCKKYRSAYINPCTSRVSTSEVCNKRKCHKALRQFFDKVIKSGKSGERFIFCWPGVKYLKVKRPVLSFDSVLWRLSWTLGEVFADMN